MKKITIKKQDLKDIINNSNNTIIRVINEDVVQFGNKFAYSDDNFKWGRFYEPISEKKVEEIISIFETIEIKEYSINEIENKKGYKTNSCFHSNGETIDFFVRIDNVIYMVSYSTGWGGGYSICTAYNIKTNEFEIAENGDAIVSDEADLFIEKNIKTLI